jgi:serine/threonine-protein kinase
VLALQREAGEPLPIQMCVRIGIEIARGLHAAHELVGHDGRSLCVVHRDLSPHNVLIGFDGAVRITDFGIAKAIGRSSYTATGVVKGKLSYMSPEQLRFEELDRRSDLFSLGVVLYELLSGERLYRNASGADEPHRLLNEPPPDIGEVRPEVPGTLTELLFDLLAKEPELRPQTSHEVAVVLEGVFAELVAGGPPMDLEQYLRHLTRGAFQERKRTLADAIARAGKAARADDTESAPAAIDPNASTTEMRRRLRPSRVGLLLGAIVLAAVVLGALGLSLVPPAATTPPNADEPESAPIAPATEAHAGEAPVAADETAEAHTTAPEDPAAATPPATAPEAPSVRTLPDRRRTPRKRRSAARTTKTPGLELRAWDGDSR